jgi:hypothetical protein
MKGLKRIIALNATNGQRKNALTFFVSIVKIGQNFH